MRESESGRSDVVESRVSRDAAGDAERGARPRGRFAEGASAVLVPATAFAFMCRGQLREKQIASQKWSRSPRAVIGTTQLLFQAFTRGTQFTLQINLRSRREYGDGAVMEMEWAKRVKDVQPSGRSEGSICRRRNAQQGGR